MKITNFNSYNLDEFIESIHVHNISDVMYTERQVREMLSPISISFCLEGINRLQSMLLCEKKFSYVQQSQRYVPVNVTTEPVVPEYMPKDLYRDGLEIFDEVIKLYNEMTVLNDTAKKRPTKDDFKHGIPYEDARYMLPLCVPTNIVVTITGDNLIDLYNLFYNYSIIMDDIRINLNKYINIELINFIMPYVHSEHNLTFNMYRTNMNELYEKEDKHVNIVGWNNNGTYNAAYGALTSQNSESPETIINDWKKNDENVKLKCTDLVNRVVSYGHKSIVEQIRNTSIMKCSLSTYHQVIRHRIHKIQRDRIYNLCSAHFTYYTPESINIIPFHVRYHNIMKMYRELFERYHTKYSDEYLAFWLPNAAYICFVVNSNASHDNWIFRERLCLTAQTEIRELYDEKFRLLYHTAPSVYSHGLPPCVRNEPCKEGKMSCGKYGELIKKYEMF